MYNQNFYIYIYIHISKFVIYMYIYVYMYIYLYISRGIKNIQESSKRSFAEQLPIFRRTSLAFNPVRVKAASSTALHKASALQFLIA